MVLKGGRKSRHRRTKHKRHHKRKHKRRTKHRRRHKMRGGGGPGTGIAPKGGSPAAPFNEKWGGPAPAFPPGPIVRPGVVDLDAKYYGKLDLPLLPDPTNTHGSGVTRTHGKVGGGRRRRGGRKSRKGGRKSRRGGRKSRRGGEGHCHCKGSGKKGGSRRRRGGSISQFLSNNVPGFSDVRDVYWKGGEILKNGYNQWFGYPHVDNTSASIQPIGKVAKVVRPNVVNVGQNLQTGADSASKYTN